MTAAGGGVRSPWVAAATAGAAVAALFGFFGNPVRGYIDTASLFGWWVHQWNNPASETEHGWLVLGLSGWLLARNLRAGGAGGARRETQDAREAEKDGTGAAAAALLGGLALHALGFVAQQTRVSIVAFLLCAWGVLRLGGGPRWGRAAAFPLAFMVFAIPIEVLDSVGFWLRVWVVDASAAIARAAGIAVLQSGTQLVAPDGTYNYDVAAACSGIRSLTAMAALALLAGYLNFRCPGRRALVFVMCFPLVYVGNVARIVAIIFAAEAGGPKWGDRAHEIMGYGIFAIVFGGTMAGVAALRRWWPEAEVGGVGCEVGGSPMEEARGETEEEARGVGREARGRTDQREGRVGAGWVVVAVVVGVAVGEAFYLQARANRPGLGAAGVRLTADGKNPVELPQFLGIEWTGRPQPVSAAEREILPPDTGYSRKLYFNHRDPSRQVFLSIVLSGRDRSSIHRPELCLVGQGWTVAEGRDHRFRGGDGQTFPATVLPVRREVQTPEGKRVVPQVVAYWFVGSDRIVASHGRRVLLDAWNRVTRGQADRWAYVLLQTDAVDGEEAALARMQAVLAEALPAFQDPRGS